MNSRRWARGCWDTTVVLATGVALASCASTAPAATGGDPFGGGVASGSRRAGQSYRVRLEVNCDDCRIQYWVGAGASNASADQLWSRTLNLAPLQAMAIRLSATPSENGRAVRYVRILVDGEVVAEQGCPDCRDATAESLSSDRPTLVAETVIGPRVP